MTRLAITIATLGFFVMALVGWACGVPNFTCGLRALGGAAMLFVFVRMAGRIVANILAETIVDDSYRRRNGGE